MEYLWINRGFGPQALYTATPDSYSTFCTLMPNGIFPSQAAAGLGDIHTILQLALQLQIDLPQLRQLRFVRLLLEAALYRFHEALDDVAEGPRVLLLEKLLDLMVHNVLVNEQRVHSVLDHRTGLRALG
jgi:hypothetical protein